MRNRHQPDSGDTSVNLSAWVIISMPTVLRIRQLRIAIYLNDHGPPHVHVIGKNCHAKIKFGGAGEKPSIVENNGLREKEPALALEMIESEQWLLRRRWREIHGG